MMFQKSHKRARALAAVAAVAAIGLALAGCSSSSSSTTTSSATKGNITWWGWTPTTALAANLIKQFNKQYPNIHVTYKNYQDQAFASALRPALASNAGPDVFNTLVGGSGAAVSIYGVDAVNLTPAIEKLRGSNWKTGLYAAGVQDFTVKGQLKGVPVGKVTSGFMWMNAGLMNKLKLKEPKTLAQWTSECKTIRAAGYGCLTEGVDAAGFEVDTLHSIANSVDPGYWTKATDGQAKWTASQMVKTLAIWKSLDTDGILNPGALGIQQYPDANNNFLSGKSAFVQMGTWYRQYADVPGLTAGLQAAGVASSTAKVPIVPVPFPNVGGNTVALFGDPDYGFSVNKKSKNIAAATTFALWVGATKPGQQVIANNLDEDPVLESVKADLSKVTLVDPSVQSPYLNSLAATLSQGVTQPRLANVSAGLDQALEDAASSVLGGQATPAQAVQTLQSASGQ
jgi:raffinose/stachyose/melibiose transport system substrate-binding protein